jgi:hypothetical protein
MEAGPRVPPRGEARPDEPVGQVPIEFQDANFGHRIPREVSLGSDCFEEVFWSERARRVEGMLEQRKALLIFRHSGYHQ